MRRSRLSRPLAVLASCLLLAMLAGCGKGGGSRSRQGDLRIEQLADTAGLSAGEPIVQEFDAYRMDSGALRVKGRVRLPDGTRVQVAVKRPGGRSSVAMVQVSLHEGAFDSPPMLGEHGPLPKARYVFEISAQFIPEWQPPEVLRETRDGMALRGPGITRTKIGGAMLWLVEDMTR